MLARPRAIRWLVHLALLALLIAVGLATRSHPHWFPRFVALYGGDTLWTAFFVVLFSLFAPAARPKSLALAAFAFSVLIELSQLWHPAWLNRLRSTRPGALLLGNAFTWSDFACYAAGALMGYFLVRILKRSFPFVPIRPGR